MKCSTRRAAPDTHPDTSQAAPRLPGTLPRPTFVNRSSTEMQGYELIQNDWLEPAPIAAAELVGSDLGDGLHGPVLDIDFPCSVLPSATPGHFHLYLDKPMTWRAYRRLLKALARAGVIERDWAKASIQGGRTLVRVPGTESAAR